MEIVKTFVVLVSKANGPSSYYVTQKVYLLSDGNYFLEDNGVLKPITQQEFDKMVQAYKNKYAVDYTELNKKLIDLTIELIRTLKAERYNVDCYSCRHNDKPSGKATDDCDIAIDIMAEPVGFEHDLLVSIEEDPYKNGSKIWRLKFKV